MLFLRSAVPESFGESSDYESPALTIELQALKTQSDGLYFQITIAADVFPDSIISEHHDPIRVMARTYPRHDFTLFSGLNRGASRRRAHCLRWSEDIAGRRAHR